MTKRALMSAAALAGMALGACGGGGGATHNVYLEGAVWNGATGERLTDYTISLQYRDQTLKGKIDAAPGSPTLGRFVLGPLPVWQDYTIIISRDGMRAFQSHNAGFDVPDAVSNGVDPAVDKLDTTQTYYYDAFLFPSDLTVPRAGSTIKFSVQKADNSSSLITEGTLRLRPSTNSAVQMSPAGVGTQVWTNDNDIQAATIEKPIANGVATIDEQDALGYGISYSVTVYGIPQYAPYTDTFVAGSMGDRVYSIQPEAAAPLLLVGNSSVTPGCNPPSISANIPSAVITLTFNTEVEESNSNLTDVSYLDSYLTYTATPSGMSPLNPTTRGTSITVNGSTVTLAWNPTQGIPQPPTYSTDTITRVTYGGLSYIYIQPKGKPLGKVSLYSLLGSSSISCPKL